MRIALDPILIQWNWVSHIMTWVRVYISLASFNGQRSRSIVCGPTAITAKCCLVSGNNVGMQLMLDLKCFTSCLHAERNTILLLTLLILWGRVHREYNLNSQRKLFGGSRNANLSDRIWLRVKNFTMQGFFIDGALHHFRWVFRWTIGSTQGGYLHRGRRIPVNIQAACHKLKPMLRGS